MREHRPPPLPAVCLTDPCLAAEVCGGTTPAGRGDAALAARPRAPPWNMPTAIP